MQRDLRRISRLGFGVLFAAGLLVSTLAGADSRLVVISEGGARALAYDGGDGSFVGAFVEPVTTGFAFPGGIAIRPSTGALYVSSTGSGEIWTYDTASGLVSPPVAASGLLAPGSMAFDASGSNLYFLADIPNGPDSDAALRRLSLPGGTVTTIASDGLASFSGLALSGSQLYVSDSLNGRLRRYSTSGGSGTTVVSGLMAPAGIFFLSPTQMVVAESGADRVVEYQESGGVWSFVRVVMAPSAGVDGPTELALAPDGRLNVSGAFSNNVVSIDLGSLAISSLVPPGGGLAVPGQIEWSGNTLLVANRGNNSVQYFDATGAPTGISARGLTAPADAGLARTPNGNLLVASVGGNRVTEYDGNSGAVVRAYTNACPTSFTQPFDVEVDSLSRVYVSCTPSDGVRRFDAVGVAASFVVAGAGGLSSPRGLTFGPNGNLFVSSLSGEVLEFDGANGSFVGVFVDVTGNGGGPVDPYALAFHQGSLVVASYFPSEVREFDADTGMFIGTLVSSGSGGLSGPRGLTFGPDGDLYVGSQGDNAIKRYDAVSGAFIENFVTSGSGGLNQPFDLIFLGSPAVPTLSLWGRFGVVVGLAVVAGQRRSGASRARLARGDQR